MHKFTIYRSIWEHDAEMDRQNLVHYEDVLEADDLKVVDGTLVFTTNLEIVGVYNGGEWSKVTRN